MEDDVYEKVDLDEKEDRGSELGFSYVVHAALLHIRSYARTSLS